MKKIVNRYAVVAASVVLTASVTLAYNNSCDAYAKFASNPVISRECPAYSSSGMGTASSANDKHYFSFWNSNAPDYLAYDLSGVPEEQRQKVDLVWYNATGHFDYTVVNGSSNGVPSDYTIEVNAAEGGDYPEDGWQTVITVENNTLHSRQHIVDMSGFNWIRINITGCDGKSGGYTSINMDVHDVSEEVSDSWIFYGDSITACGMMNCYGTGFAAHVNEIDSSYFPIQENGGIGGIRSSDGAENIDRWLESFPGKYVSIAYGTNDAWGNPSATQQYYENTSYMVESVINAGKTPIVPKIPYSTEPAVGDNVPAYNAMIEKIYDEYPEVVKGPDFETFFYENPDLLSSDGVHPSDSGYAAMRELWAQTMYNEVYLAESGNDKVKGDVNEDGRFNVADAVMFQKWILNDDELINWESGDVNDDGILDIFDLCIMRRMLTE